MYLYFVKEIRKQIDEIDAKILKLLGKRFKIAPKLAKMKKKEKLPVLDKKREVEVFKKLEKIAKKEGVDKKLVEKLWKEILKESRKIQKKH